MTLRETYKGTIRGGPSCGQEVKAAHREVFHYLPDTQVPVAIKWIPENKGTWVPVLGKWYNPNNDVTNTEQD